MSFQESTPRDTITRVAMLTELSSDGMASFQVKLYAMRANQSQINHDVRFAMKMIMIYQKSMQHDGSLR